MIGGITGGVGHGITQGLSNVSRLTTVHTPRTVRGLDGRLRDPSTGRYVADPSRTNSTATTTAGSTHGNARASTATTQLYRLTDSRGKLLKWAMSSNLSRRYTQAFLQNKRLQVMTSGSRDHMLNLERWIVERDAGPLNREPWAMRFR